MDTFAFSLSNKVVEMPNFRLDGCFQGRNQKAQLFNEKQAPNEDLLMEQILENINTTPIGQVLKKIVSLPGFRREKILEVRRKLTEGQYDLNERLDIALEKVLDDLIA